MNFYTRVILGLEVRAIKTKHSEVFVVVVFKTKRPTRNEARIKKTRFSLMRSAKCHFEQRPLGVVEIFDILNELHFQFTLSPSHAS